MSLAVAGLYVYPLKSARGISLKNAVVGPMGIRYDRQWVVTSEHGEFVAQRSDAGKGVGIKSMCLIRTEFRDRNLVLTAPGMGSLSVPLEGVDGPSVPVRVWKSSTSGIYQGSLASKWVTEYLSKERPGKYRLVRMSEKTIRAPKLGSGQLAYADAYSFLVISLSSLDDLNTRLTRAGHAAIPMDRFRPNITLYGAVWYEEDRLSEFEIGSVKFYGQTLCVRCPITQTDQLTGVRHKTEPLRTLATYRRHPHGGVVFGKNFNHKGFGVISVGDLLKNVQKEIA
ncbi:MAG TPA: MOSC N-terminal beta barrel domain-containing protein [Patescibacteria group bacterium]|nr:MOSC N-terminal beta barrel domain-containing protein [Patescibacteria group bacterium]